MDNPESTFFAPQLMARDVGAALEFYKAALGAVELRRWANPDGSVHVAEMSIDGALFHIHKDVPGSGQLSPTVLKGTTVVIGLFVDDPSAVMKRAVAAGGREIQPVKDYDYGFRQGSLSDPAGHHWLIQKKLG
jgi:PhnB protein